MTNIKGGAQHINQCPNCQSYHTDCIGNPSFDGGASFTLISVEWECLDCGNAWMARYQYYSTTNLGTGE